MAAATRLLNRINSFIFRPQVVNQKEGLLFFHEELYGVTHFFDHVCFSPDDLLTVCVIVILLFEVLKVQLIERESGAVLENVGVHLLADEL